jgi:hypothetical protein
MVEAGLFDLRLGGRNARRFCRAFAIDLRGCEKHYVPEAGVAAGLIPFFFAISLIISRCS